MSSGRKRRIRIIAIGLCVLLAAGYIPLRDWSRPRITQTPARPAEASAQTYLLQENAYARMDELSRIGMALKNFVAFSKTAKDYMDMADQWIAQGEYPWAIRALGQAIASHAPGTGGLAQLWLKKGALETLAEQPDAALQSLTTAVTLDPALPDGWLVLAQLHAQRGEDTETILALEQYLALKPDDAQYRMALAQLQLGQGKFEAARDNAAVVLAADDASADTHLLRGNALMSLAAYQDALADFDAAVALGMENADIHTARATCHMALGQYAEALTAFTLAQEQGADPVRMAYFRGVCAYQLGDFPMAHELLAQAYQGGQRGQEMDFMLGVSAMNTGDMESARAAFGRSIAVGEMTAESHYNRGMIFVQQDDVEQAGDDFSLAIENGFVTADVYAARGACSLARGLHVQALADFETAAAKGADANQMAYYQGLCLYQMGQYEKALPHLALVYGQLTCPPILVPVSELVEI